MRMQSVWAARTPVLCRLQVLLILLLSVSDSTVLSQGVFSQLPSEVADAIDDERYGEAERKLRESESDIPKEVLGWLKVRQGQEELGLVIFRELIESDPAPSSDRLTQLLVMATNASPAFGNKVRTLVRNQIGDIKDAEMTLAELRLAVANSELDEASALATKLLVVGKPEDQLGLAITELAIAYQRKGDHERALKLYETMMASMPETGMAPEYLMQKVHFLNGNGSHAVAMKQLDQLRGDYPDYYSKNKAIFSTALALAYEGMGDEDRALEYFKEVEALAASDPTAAGFAALAHDKVLEKERTKQLTDESDARVLAEKADQDAEDAPIENQSGGWRMPIILINAAVLAIFGFLYWQRRLVR